MKILIGETTLGKFYKSITDKVYNIIKRQIVNLDYAFGENINIVEIAKKFGISSTPIRDVLNRLEKDGLVVVKPRVGYFVRKFNKDLLYEVFEIREMIEGFALCHQRSNNYKKYENLKKDLLSLKNKITQSNISKKDFYNEYVTLDRKLHLTIIERCKNTELIKLYHNIFSYIQISQNLGIDKNQKSLLIGIEEVILLLEKLLNKDILSAKIVLKKHLENSKNISIRYLF